MTTDKPQFQSLRWRLLLSYLGVMVSILGVCAIAIYQWFAYNLDQQLDQHLLTLAQAAAHSLVDIKQDRAVVDSSVHRLFERDFPWQPLPGMNQSVEWFNSNQQLLAQSGTPSPDLSLQVGSQTLPQVHIRTLTIPAYSYSNNQSQLEGYVRVSESTNATEYTLIQLRWGLGLGGLVALILSGICGKWLTSQSLKPIERSFDQLEQFATAASDQLRRPLMTIKTSAEVMQTHSEQIHPSQIKKLDTIINATSLIIGLVEDLLLLAKIDSVSVKMAQQQVANPLDELLEDLLHDFEVLAQQKEITLKSDLCADVYVAGNRNQLRRLFSNLLENALQSTLAGGVVTLMMFHLDNWVLVSVEDTGIGIAPRDLPHIFDRFWQTDQSRTAPEGGTGLGLAIAQSIAESYGGKITVNSQLGLGTCFQVRLPYQP